VPWTVEQVLALVPDARAARAGRELASARRWSGLGRSDAAVWGRHQGSAAQPYQVLIDPVGPTFRCTCASQKRPCKHVLGLFLLYASDPAAIPDAEAPPEIAAWVESLRRAPPERRAADRTPAELERASIDQARRARRREERIHGGIDDLERWLHDLARVGLAEAGSRPWSYFEHMAARLVDAQAPGLARMVRDLGALPHTTARWPERMLIDLGRLTLLLQAWRGQDDLSPELRADVRTLVGIAPAREEVLTTDPVHDAWEVLGRRVLEGERMRVQRTWLRGRGTQKWALLLDFAVGGRPIELNLRPGSAFELDLCFYPAAYPLRALPSTPARPSGAVSNVSGQSIPEVARGFAAALGRNPWLERLPVVLSGVTPYRVAADRWCVIGEGSLTLPLPAGDAWHLLAISGGHPTDLFGEWDGFTFWPLAALASGRLSTLGQAAA
jgi:hypothetical protein